MRTEANSQRTAIYIGLAVNIVMQQYQADLNFIKLILLLLAIIVILKLIYDVSNKIFLESEDASLSVTHNDC